MILLELFDKPLEYTKSSGNQMGMFTDSYKFTTSNNYKYNVNIYHVSDFRSAGINIEGTGIGIDFQNTNVIANDQGITNTGSEIEVFSTVLDIVSRAVKELDPEIISFGAHESSRQKLYDRLIKVMLRKFNYELLKGNRFLTNMGKSKGYILKKSTN